jgi:hypothetical protein
MIGKVEFIAYYNPSVDIAPEAPTSDMSAPRKGTILQAIPPPMMNLIACPTFDSRPPKDDI